MKTRKCSRRSSKAIVEDTVGCSGVQWGTVGSVCSGQLLHQKLNIKFLVHFVYKLKMKFNLPECTVQPPPPFTTLDMAAIVNPSLELSKWRLVPLN